DDAAVGSISNILRTAFKNLWQEEDLNAEGCPEPSAPAQVSKDLTGEPERSLGTALLADGTSDEKEESSDVAVPPPSAETTLTPAMPAAVAERLAQIDNRLRKRHAEAGSLLKYLAAQHDAAEADDLAAANALKRKGVLVGAHVPIGPTSLRLDKSRVEEFGPAGVGMLSAERLMRERLQQAKREAGNAPWAGGDGDGIPHSAASVRAPEEPGYLKQTSNNLTRRAVVLEGSYGPAGRRKYRPGRSRHAPTTCPEKKAATAAAAVAGVAGIANPGGASKAGIGDAGGALQPAVTAAAAAVAPTVAVAAEISSPLKARQNRCEHQRASGTQRDADRELVQRMERRLDFLRHPRHDPGSRFHSKLLTVADAPSTVAPYFEAEPAVLTFTDYEPGKLYSATLSLRNVSAVARNLRVLPPSTSYFRLVKIVWPAAHPGGDSSAVAPGMAVRVIIEFVPDGRGAYTDFVTVATEAGSWPVAVRAARRPPVLTLPPGDVFDCGACLLGRVRCRRFRITNRGGAVRFRLVSEDGWQSPPGPAAPAVFAAASAAAAGEGAVSPGGAAAAALPAPPSPQGFLRLGPFLLSPADVALEKGDSCVITVAFLPAALGAFRRELVLVQDNCDVRRLSVAGHCEQVQLRVSALAGVAVPANDARAAAALPTLRFRPAPLGLSRRQVIEVSNDGAVDVHFHWELRSETRAAATAQAAAIKAAPAAGTLAAGKGATFSVSFCPTSAGLAQFRAELVLESVPAAAL
ncbi:unnamed protein product, partial [Phaeothamnion confervicola]